jgi:hypothetical protein
VAVPPRLAATAPAIGPPDHPDQLGKPGHQVERILRRISRLPRAAHDGEGERASQRGNDDSDDDPEQG